MSIRELQAIQLFRTEDAAKFLGLSRRTLEKLRCTGGGPAYIKMGRRMVAYNIADLQAWVESRRRVSTSDTGQAA